MITCYKKEFYALEKNVKKDPDICFFALYNWFLWFFFFLLLFFFKRFFVVWIVDYSTLVEKRFLTVLQKNVLHLWFIKGSLVVNSLVLLKEKVPRGKKGSSRFYTFRRKGFLKCFWGGDFF